MLVQIMHTIASALQTPVIVVLLGLTLIMIAVLGMLVAEFFTERRYFKLSLPSLVEELNLSSDAVGVIEQSGMLRRQKRVLLELLDHPEATESDRESLAVNMVAEEQRLFDNRIKVTDLIAKVAPMLGLMGTLIPLGPGIVAIGEGSTALLSESLLIAFDTTVLGLIVGAVALFVSTVRKQWYAKYMSAFEAATECVLEKANERALAERDSYRAECDLRAAEYDSQTATSASPIDAARHSKRDIQIPRGPQQEV